MYQMSSERVLRTQDQRSWRPLGDKVNSWGSTTGWQSELRQQPGTFSLQAGCGAGQCRTCQQAGCQCYNLCNTDASRIGTVAETQVLCLQAAKHAARTCHQLTQRRQTHPGDTHPSPGLYGLQPVHCHSVPAGRCQSWHGSEGPGLCRMAEAS